MQCRKPLVHNTLVRDLYERGWSDIELAARAGLSVSRINRIKNGRLRPTTTDALMIARVLGRPVERIFRLPERNRG